MCKLACNPTTHASRPTGDDGDSAFKSSHLSEDYDAFPLFQVVSEALAPVNSPRVDQSCRVQPDGRLMFTIPRVRAQKHPQPENGESADCQWRGKEKGGL